MGNIKSSYLIKGCHYRKKIIADYDKEWVMGTDMETAITPSPGRPVRIHVILVGGGEAW